MKITILLKFALFLSFIFLSFGSYGQTEKVLQSTRSLGEADFHFDVMYKIVDCGDGIPRMLITTFNESGKKNDVAFDIVLKDNKGTVQTIKVPFFYSKLGEMLIPSCSDTKNKFLIHALDSNLDWKSMKTEIKFYSK